jgi:hypothetical protein
MLFHHHEISFFHLDVVHVPQVRIGMVRATKDLPEVRREEGVDVLRALLVPVMEE